jgi:hypothetical protein
MNRHCIAFIIALTSTIVILSMASFLNDVPTRVFAQTSYPDGTFRVVGEVTNPLTVTIDDLTVMPETEVNASLYCQNQLVSDGTWGGVAVRYLLETAGAASAANGVEFYASDGYRVDFALGIVLEPNVIIAYEFNDQPLPSLQLVLPDQPGSLWIRMITEINLTATGGASVSPVTTFGPPPNELIQPTNTSQPTEIPTPTAVPTTSASPTPTTNTPQPTETGQQSSTSTPVTQPDSTTKPQNQTTSSLDTNVLGAQQTQPEPTPRASSWNYNYLFAGAIATVAVVAVILIVRRIRSGSSLPK